jgi:Cdc6-like AAA superfamily ATPase
VIRVRAALNRVARLLAAAHGGQTLMTLATQELVRDALPAHASLVDLGQHRLKDLSQPEHIYQLAAPDLPAQLPPIRTLDARPTNVPPRSTLLIGREREVAAVLGLLHKPDVRLVTLTGSGGTGKTSLSLQVAADLLDEYDDGVWFVDLTSVADPDMVVPAIAGALNRRHAALRGENFGGRPARGASCTPTNRCRPNRRILSRTLPRSRLICRAISEVDVPPAARSTARARAAIHSPVRPRRNSRLRIARSRRVNRPRPDDEGIETDW